MKVKLLLLVMVLVTCVASVGYAQELSKRFDIGISGGGVFPKDSEIDTAGYIGGNIAYGVNEYIAIGGEAGYTKWKDEENSIHYGDVTAVPLLADLYLRYPIDMGEKKLVPYGVGGIGVVFWDYEESSLLKDNNISVNMGSKLGVKLGAGADFFLTNNIAINLEGSYLWSDANMTVSAFGTTASATIDTDSWFLTGGLKYYF